MTIKAVSVISGSSGASGILHFTQENPQDGIMVQGKISGLKPGLHGLNIHALGDTSNGCASTGSHFNPHNKPHGGPNSQERHVGDLGNIEAGADGCAEVAIFASQILLSGPFSIIGRSVVVYADPDDLGKGCNASSKTTGNSGARVACGVIGLKVAP